MTAYRLSKHRCPTLAITALFLAILIGACSRDTSRTPERTPSTAAADPWAASHNANDDISNREMVEMAKGGMRVLLEKEREVRGIRDKQIADLESKLAEVQRLLIAGNYDEAEIRLVAIAWKPVEPGTNGDNELIRQYEEKRASLTSFLQRKRGTSPAR